MVSKNATGVIITDSTAANSLGLIRGFGRRGIPVVYLDSEPHSMERHSKYITQRLKCPSLRESETAFINALLDFGQHIDGKMVIIPTGDREVLALSKHRKELEQFYLLPLPSHEIAQKLVNKKSFYKLLAEMQLPHPETYFPENTNELRLMGREIDYPYIIKPAYSLPFQEAFHQKCFLIKSSPELDRATGRLEDKNLEAVIQEIIPGKGAYAFLTYFNRKSEPLATCGWDKIRHYPPDFGSGSFCRSSWRLSAVEPGLSLLKAIGYSGLAAPELKKDPRDGQYKIIEVNARTVLQNRLAAACGLDIAYLAYLDAIGQLVNDLLPQRDDVSWVDEFADPVSCLIHLKRKEIGIGEIFKSLQVRKVYSVAAWDDPIPFIVHAFYQGLALLRLICRNLSGG